MAVCVGPSPPTVVSHLTAGWAGKGFFAPKAPFWEKPGFIVWTGAQVGPCCGLQAMGVAAAHSHFQAQLPFFLKQPAGCAKPATALCMLSVLAAQEDPTAAEEKFAAAGGQYAGIKKDADRSRKTVTRTGLQRL